jgi:hypothetical protein
VVALRWLPGATSPVAHAALTEAVTGLPPGARLRVCPGVHGTREPLLVADARDVTIDGTDAVVLLTDEGTLVEVQRADGLRLTGLTLTRAWASGDDAPDSPALVGVEGGRGVRLEGLTLDAAGSPALRVRGAPDTVVAGTTMLDATAAFVLPDATPGATAVTLSGGRLLRLRALTEPVAAEASIARGVDAPVLESGRGERPTPARVSPPPPPEAVAALDWPGVMARHRGAGVRIWQDRVYLVVAHTWGTPPGASAAYAANHEAGRPSPPIPAPKRTGATALPVRDRGHVHLFTPEGTCRAKVGAPVFVDTLGCESGYMTAFPLEGCGTTVAPVALIGPSPPALKYVRRTEIPFAPGPDALPPDTRRALVETAFADSLLGGWERVAAARERATVRYAVGTPTESIEAVYLGFQYDVLECSIFKRTFVEAFALGAGRPTQVVALPADLVAQRPFEGALLAGEHLAALTTADMTTVGLYGRAPDGTYPELFGAEVFTDNAECIGGAAPVDFEYPCAP